MINIMSSLQLALLILLASGKIYNIESFVIQNGMSTQNAHHGHWYKLIPNSMVSDPIISSESSKVVDGNGIEFTEGCTIQICSEIRAYHVARKGYGSFDEDSKSFIPLEGLEDISSVPRKDRCLILSKGLRGLVRKVYDIGEFDATAPIVARFEEGESLGGDLVSPVTFAMHFETHEVEVVEE